MPENAKDGLHQEAHDRLYGLCKRSRASSQAVKPGKPRALVLFSGGLDSRLVCKLLEGQLGRENVEAVFFMLPLGGGCCNDRFCVLKFAQTQLLKLHIIDCTRGRMFRKYMDIVKNPRFQRGAGMNPCIDCHLFMLREAKGLAKKIRADFLATGEVLGERPLSQNKQALNLIERKAGLEGKLLRPLSAKLLPETEAEKKGWINRKKLLDIQGRQRRRQIALAKKYRIKFPSPGGGCLLTDKEFSRRLGNLLDLRFELNMDYIGLLKLGRHFRRGGNIIIVGRREGENQRLLKIARKHKIPHMEAKDYMGPDTLIFGKPSKTIVQKAASLTVRYSDAPKNKQIEVILKKGRLTKILKSKAISKRGLERLRV